MSALPELDLFTRHGIYEAQREQEGARRKRNGQADAKLHVPLATREHVMEVARIIADNGGPFSLTETTEKFWAGRQVRVVSLEIDASTRLLCDKSPGFWGAMSTWIARTLDCPEVARAETVNPDSHRRKIAIRQKVQR